MYQPLLLLIFVVGSLFVALACWSFLEFNNAIAFAIGYLVFTFDVYILAVVSKVLIKASLAREGDEKTKSQQLVGFLLAALKLVFLSGVLYMAIVWWKLSGLYLAGGALFSLFLFVFCVVISQLKALAEG
jgi:hypothetical protein